MQRIKCLGFSNKTLHEDLIVKEASRSEFYYVIFEKVAQLGWISVGSEFPENGYFKIFWLDWNRKID